MPTKAKEPIAVLEFEILEAKETKNCFRYVEVAKQNMPSKVGSLYLQKWVTNGSKPLKLKVTIEEIEA